MQTRKLSKYLNACQEQYVLPVLRPLLCLPHSVNTLLKFSKYISKYSSLDMYAYISLAIVGGCCCCVQLLRYIRFDSEKFDSQLIALLTA